MIRGRELCKAGACLAMLMLIGCTGPSAPVPEVGTIIAEPREVVVGEQLPGRTRASEVVKIRTRVSSIVIDRAFAEGAEVRRGDVLYRLDQAPFLAAVKQAEAGLAVARANAARGRAALRSSLARLEPRRALAAMAHGDRRRLDQLFDEGVLSAAEHGQISAAAAMVEAQWVAAQGDVESDRQAVAAGKAEIVRAEAALEIARIDLADTWVTAPIGGQVIKSSAAEGAVVTPSQPAAMATIMDLDPIYVDLTLPSGRAVADESVPVKVRLATDDGTSYPLEGTFDVREQTIDPETGMATLRAVFPNPQGFLRPGMRVRVFVRRGIEHQGIAIPERAVRRESGGTPHAMVVDKQGRVGVRALEIVGADGGQWLVRSGLAGGEQIIVEGLADLRAGDVVRAVRVDLAARRI